MGPRNGIGIELPGFGTVRVDVPVEGTFVLVKEQTRTQQVVGAK
jgi:proline racemase